MLRKVGVYQHQGQPVREVVTSAVQPNNSKEYKGKSKYFFLNKRLYRLMDTDPVGDKILAYDFQDHQKKVYLYSEYKKYKETAYTLPEVAKIIGRSYWYTYRHVMENIPWVGTVATYDENYEESGAWRRYYYSKQDVLDIHKYMANLDTRGGNRHHKQGGMRNFPKPKNKLVKRTDMPTREEVLARLNSDEVYYVKNDKGEFVPVFVPR